jgi:hypothetical protein
MKLIEPQVKLKLSSDSHDLNQKEIKGGVLNKKK